MTDRLTDAELDEIAEWVNDRARTAVTIDAEAVAALVAEVREHRAARTLTSKFLDGCIVTHGVLGWGNRKGGLEAYGPEGRWGEQSIINGRGAGDLLGDHLNRLGVTEGANLVVIAVPRSVLFVAPDKALAIIDRITEEDDRG